MQSMLLKMALAIVTKLLTDKLLSKIIVYSLWSLSQKTDNKLDDKTVEAIAEALDVTDYK